MAEPTTSYIYLSNGRILLIGENLENDEHRHHALQITINLTADTFIMRRDGREFSLHGAVISPNSPHQVVSSATWRAVILLDAQTQYARQINDRFNSESGIAALPVEDMAFCREVLRDFAGRACSIDAADRAITRVIERMAGPAVAPAPHDARVAKVLALIPQAQGSDLSVGFLARQVFISESRLSHLFKAEIGIPLQHYLLWYKVAQAGFNIGRGMSLTQAAGESGFADSAHFSRAFRAMFGITPSQILKRGRYVQVISDSTD
jgi:AraC-like DNA-binding protein